jgi:IMP cyclohydrolase
MANPYPGRGLVWARLPGGAWCGAYFLTGRSEASRQREIRLAAGGELVVLPTGATEHDALRHYVAATETDDWLVYGNGEQVSTVRERLVAGRCPADALQDLAYEPDPPIFTPRITAVVDLRHPGRAWLGMARHARGDREAGIVVILAAHDLAPGGALLLTTYDSDGTTIEPAQPLVETATTAGHAEELVDQIWSALAPQRRVAVAAFHPGRLTSSTIHRNA